MPAPCKGAGEGATYRAAAPSFSDHPWLWEISNGDYETLYYAAREAVRFAEALFDLDREYEDGRDLVGRIQARWDATPEMLRACLPPMMNVAVRREAERLLLWESQIAEARFQAVKGMVAHG
ncbi:hypothetical protein G432_12325 [Sphingomonas sp. MM-1]|nr:hypothetical protein G432_12325 [Sphingomonas sp. MM-1]